MTVQTGRSTQLLSLPTAPPAEKWKRGDERETGRPPNITVIYKDNSQHEAQCWRDVPPLIQGKVWSSWQWNFDQKRSVILTPAVTNHAGSHRGLERKWRGPPEEVHQVPAACGRAKMGKLAPPLWSCGSGFKKSISSAKPTQYWMSQETQRKDVSSPLKLQKHTVVLVWQRKRRLAAFMQSVIWISFLHRHAEIQTW